MKRLFKHLYYFFGFAVVLAGVTLNLTTMLYKAADVFRGTLTGTELEHALLMITVVPAAAFIGFGYMYWLVMRSYKIHVLRECTKCNCKSCIKR